MRAHVRCGKTDSPRRRCQRLDDKRRQQSAFRLGFNSGVPETRSSPLIGRNTSGQRRHSLCACRYDPATTVRHSMTVSLSSVLLVYFRTGPCFEFRWAATSSKRLWVEASSISPGNTGKARNTSSFSDLSGFIKKQLTNNSPSAICLQSAL